MVKNNKITRAEARKQSFVQVQDGTEVLHSKEARQKNRRWTFQADMKLIVAAHKNETGKDIPMRVLPERTMNLDAVSYGSAKQARVDCANHEQYLRSVNPLFKDSIIKIRAIPHETVSGETLRQIEGYRDMSLILDRALQLSIEEAQQVVEGKAVGAQFMCAPAQEATGEVGTPNYTPSRPERSVLSIKEEFYKRALEICKPKEQSNENTAEAGRGSNEGNTGLEDGTHNSNFEPNDETVSQVILTDQEASSSSEEHSSPEPAPVNSNGEEEYRFEPEIIHIQRSGKSESQDDAKEVV